jgi:hypothetical protein
LSESSVLSKKIKGMALRMIDYQFCHKTVFLSLFFLIISSIIGCAPATPLTKAARDGNVPAIRTLLNNGANINEPDSKQGWTPLYWAIYYNRPDTVQILLDNGAMVNIQDADGNSPLMIAITHGSIIISKFLLGKGADVNVRNKKQETPLLKAVYSGEEEVVKMLVCKNADVESYDANGLNAINHAEYDKYINTVQLLYKAKYVKRRNSSTDMSQMCSHSGSQEEKIEIVDLPPRLYAYSINYHNIRPIINFTGNKSVAVVVQDRRSYILSGDYRAEYVGRIGVYGHFGYYYISTLTGKSLYEEISHCISESLKWQGFKALSVAVKPHYTSLEVLENIKKANVDRMIFMTITDWWSQAECHFFMKPSSKCFSSSSEFVYDVTLTVLNEKGQEIARSVAKGADNLGSVPTFVYYAHFQKVQESAERVLQKLLNSSDISLALQ